MITCSYENVCAGTFRLPGAGVTEGCKPPKVGTGAEPGTSGRATSLLKSEASPKPQTLVAL